MLVGSFSPEGMSSQENTFHMKGRQLCSQNAGFADRGREGILEKNQSSCYNKNFLQEYFGILLSNNPSLQMENFAKGITKR